MKWCRGLVVIAWLATLYAMWIDGIDQFIGVLVGAWLMAWSIWVHQYCKRVGK